MERITADLATEWAAGGHEVTCFTTPLPEGADDHELRAAGVRVVVLPGRSGRYSGAWREAVRSTVDPEEFDVVLGVSSGAASLLGVATSTPILMQAHGTALAEIVSKVRTMRPRALAGAARNLMHVLEDWRDYPRYAAVVAVGPGVAHDLTAVPSRFRPRRIETVVNGVRPMVPAAAGGVSATGNVVLVGRLRREKGPDLLLRALRFGDWTATLVGDGPERVRLLRLAGRLGVADRVRFAGSVNRAGVASALAAADLVLLPSRRREGLPLVLLEAMSIGRKVLMSRQIAASLAHPPAPGEVLADLRPRTIADAVDAALASPEPGTGMPAVYTIRACARGYLELFERLRLSPARAEVTT